MKIFLTLALATLTFGQRLREKIVNGQELTERKLPWLGSIQIKNYGHDCAANLISPSLAITATHCLRGLNPSDIRVTFNRFNLSLSVHEDDGVDFEVVEFNINLDYKKGLIEEDFAFLRLKPSEDTWYNLDKLTYARLPTLADFDFPHEYFTAGWGRTDPRFSKISPTLRYTPMVPYNMKNRTEPPPAIKAKFKDAMVGKGDSGGPLYFTENGVDTLVGITSAVGADGTSFFTSVMNYRTSIQRFLNK